MRTVVVIASMALCACTGPAEQQSLDPTALEAELSEFLATYLTVLENRDLDRLTDLYAPAGRFHWIEDGQLRYRSADEVARGLESLPPDATLRTEFSEQIITALGDRGAVASMRFETVVGDGPGAFAFGGMMSIALEREGDGWKIVAGHTSSEREDTR